MHVCRMDRSVLLSSLLVSIPKAFSSFAAYALQEIWLMYICSLPLITFWCTPCSVPNSINILVCPPGLHITLGIFTKIFTLLKELCHHLDLELAFHNSDDGQSIAFAYTAKNFKNYKCMQLKCWKLNSHKKNLEEVVTYMVLG